MFFNINQLKTMKRLCLILLPLMLTSNLFAQYDTLHTESMGITVDTTVNPEYYKIRIVLVNYGHFVSISKRHSEFRYIGLDSCETILQNKLTNLRINFDTIHVHGEQDFRFTVNSGKHQVRMLSFDVDTKREAKLIYDSLFRADKINVTVYPMVSDSTEIYLKDRLRTKAIQSAYHSAQKSITAQGYDSFYIQSIGHNFFYTPAFEYVRGYINQAEQRSISYDYLVMSHSIQFSFVPLTRRKSLKPGN